MEKQGLFVGLATLDFLYLTPKMPQKNEKIVAIDDTMGAGGPAANAAVTYAHFGNRVKLVTVLGHSTISNLIKGDLEDQVVKIIDLDLDRQESPPVSSIIITQSTGDRAVISLNATKCQGSVAALPSDPLQNIDVVLIDGHQMAASRMITREARTNGIPVVLDGGSWKEGLNEVLPFVDYAICSSNFSPPGCENQENVFAYLSKVGITHIAITVGEKPIQYLSNGQRGELPVPQIKPVDTLGAGDIFHGAFCHYILENREAKMGNEEEFPDALMKAAKIASHSCEFFGPRKWMKSVDS